METFSSSDFSSGTNVTPIFMPTLEVSDLVDIWELFYYVQTEVCWPDAPVWEIRFATHQTLWELRDRGCWANPWHTTKCVKS